MAENKDIEGRWWKIENRVDRTITAKYDRLKDWKMDPKGYFLIKVDRESKLIRVGHCTFPGNKMVAEVIGKTAMEIVNTIVRENMVSSLQHAADLGIELHKAELALKHGYNYTQDDELIPK
jgi:dihydropteroate synthase